ncbi:MAG: mechanosensitive ion channel domain-containing protein [Flavobacteriaceae bacterium]
MKELKEFLNYTFSIGENFKISIQSLLIIILVFIITSIILRFIRAAVTRKIKDEDKGKFITVFSFVKYFVFVILFLVVLSNSGVQLTAVFTGTAALLIGVGLALQTFFQDIISGIFILVDQSLNVDDIIEIDGKVGKVISINLRTTKVVTIQNKVLIIPNHLYLTNTLFNWTQNETITRESVDVGVAYGSDVQLVKKLLLEATENINGVLRKPAPLVLFNDFGDSSLNFKLVFTVRDSFTMVEVASNLRFEIDRLFREHKVTIPFPQRDVHLFQTK